MASDTVNGYHGNCLQIILADGSIKPSFIHVVGTSFWGDGINYKIEGTIMSNKTNNTWNIN